jgi:hypothetical protein
MTTNHFDPSQARDFVGAKWDAEIVPQLVEYIRIPNKSPMFDKPTGEARLHGAGGVADGDLGARAGRRSWHDMEVVRLEGRTPLIFIEIPAANGGRRHRAALRPPRQAAGDDRLGRGPGRVETGAQGDKLYGRGGADDGYAIYGSLAAILALQEQALPHARCVVLIEACEESGSYDLPAMSTTWPPHRQAVAGRLPGFRLRQLRPAVVHHLAARHGRRQPHGAVLNEGVHSGDASGIVPSSFRITARAAVAAGGRNRPAASSSKACSCEIPPQRIATGRQGPPKRAGRPRSTTQVPVSARHDADGERPDRTGAQPHVAARAVDDRRGRAARWIGRPATCCARTPR